MAFPPTRPPFARALTEREYNDPTPVQTAVLAPDAATRDLLVSAQTGSGKTVAFGLAIAPTLLGDAETFERASAPLALIVAPTRELALQVQREFEWLYKHTGARIVSCVGGMDPRQERRQMAEGCHIVVGTPGRLRDHLERGNLKIDALKAVVLDEADEMLDLGFREDLEFILSTTPAERRTLLFSATLPREIVALAKTYQRDAMRIAASGSERSHADIEYRAMRIASHDAEHAVVNVLRFFESPGALVFCNTRDAVRHLSAILLERGFYTVSLSGELSQGERNHALQALRDGRARVCVATDVAARGIDLPNLNLVIHFDLPNDAETLQHRSGRTGRAGRKGVSVLLIPPARKRRAESLLSIARIQPVWGGAPTPDDIRKLDQDRLLQSPLIMEPAQEDDLAMADILLSQRAPRDIAAALVRVYRSQLPAAEDVAEVAATQPARDYSKGRNTQPRHERSDRPEKQPFNAPENTVWFRLSVGRDKNADPKWLIPEICRQGEITKREIGSIRIFDSETKFEVDEKVAVKFAELIQRPTKGGIFIGPTEAPGGGGGGKKSWSKPAGQSQQDTPKYDKPKFDKPKFDKPKYDKPKYEKSKFDKPKFDKPKFDKPKYDKPKFDKPRHDAKPEHRDKPHGEKPRGERRHGEKSHGHKTDGGKPHGGKRPGSAPWHGSNKKPPTGKKRPH